MNESYDEPSKLPDTVLDDSYSQAIRDKNKNYWSNLKLDRISLDKAKDYLNYRFHDAAPPPPDIMQQRIEALHKVYESMWKSDFIAFNDKPNYKYKFSGFKESSPCAEAQVAEKPKTGHLFIQLREGEEYATDHQESI